MSHEQVFDLIPAYALGALNEMEARLVQEHLEQCAACQSELRAYRQVAEDLALAVHQRTPPETIKQRLMARVRLTASQPQKAPETGGFLAWLTHLTPAWSLVSLVLLLTLVVSNVWLWQRLNNQTQREKFHVVTLAGTDFTPGSSGVLVISTDGADGTLVVENLPVLDEAQQYQLWLIKDGARTSGGVFSVSKTGYGHMGIWDVGSLLDYQAFGITIEPAGGSPGPTGKKVLGGDL